MITTALLAAGLPSFEWPSWEETARVLSMRDYNTRVVVLGVAALGLASGVVGSFMLLRKRALLGDALSHATLPGIAAAFILMVVFGGSGKWLPGLLLGAALAGAFGLVVIVILTRYTRLKQDAALGIVLSVFFGAGAAGLGLIQNMRAGHAAGLETFIYGKTASMVAHDAWAIAVAAALTCVVSLAMFKEMTLLCFDAGYAATLGRPVLLLDGLLMLLVVVVAVIGLQAVGLILMVALLVIPPAAARFWTERLGAMVCIAGLFGAAAGALGATTSALFARLPAGALIVLVAGVGFGISMALGRARGALPRWLAQARLTHKVHRQHLLRAMYELAEGRVGLDTPLHASRTDAESVSVTSAELMAQRSWSAPTLRRVLGSAQRDGLIVPDGEGWRLSRRGREAAWRSTRNHRLWELFLVRHADVAASHVDRDADQVEHVLDPRLIEELERVLELDDPRLARLASPHALTPRAEAPR